MRIEDLSAFNAVREAGMAKLLPSRPRIAIGMGTCGSGNGAEGVYHAFASANDRRGLGFHVARVGCFGFCAEEPLVNVWLPGMPLVVLHRVQANYVDPILDDLSQGRIPVEHALCKIEEWDHITAHVKYGSGLPQVPGWNEVPFFRGQKKIVLRNCGLISPSDIEEYIAVGGYQALYEVLIDEKPEAVIEQLKAAKLRGRGGAGYQTSLKWEFLRAAKADQKYIICNADEGDPGAYMNRNEIESDPHSLLEGMIIGGYVMGATEGIIYVRAEYPLAVHRLNCAIDAAKKYGLLGKDILGRGFNFNISLVEGAGAFVCGEETALIHSLEGKAGRPSPRPPYPAERGLYGKPTNINNVETWYNIAPIIVKGPDWFNETGSPRSPGTKVFSLVGKVRNTGLVEMPFGTPLKTFVYDIGEGESSGRLVKAVQTGGPSGGCIPQEMFDTPVDYETLAQLGSIMGSGGMVVMDEDNCMVDVARYFIEFTHSESCGKCVPCRVGLDKALQILNGITRGSASEADMATIDELGRMIRDMSLCGLGQTAPNPVLTTMRHFRQEFEDHIRAMRCRAGVCEELALSPCENSCPLHMNIPRYLQLYKEDRMEEAFESVIMDNPLPASTGRVCQHPCENRCRRAGMDQAVNMREVHRFIADSIFRSDRYDSMVERIAARRLPSSGMKIAIVGAGPAGLTCSYYLALLGHECTVFDPNSEPGGMLRYALPEYRLPNSVLDKEIELIRRLGVKFVGNTRVGVDMSVDELESEHDAVFLAIGTWRESSIRMDGAELGGVMSSLHFLEAISNAREVPLGRDVVVIGGGNSAIDSARTALRMGSSVKIVYRRERKDMPAIREETEAAEAEGARIVFLAAPRRIIGNKEGRIQAIEVIKTRLGEFDKSGRRRPIPTEEIMRLDCDTVLYAIGESVDAEFARAAGINIKDSGVIEVDRYTLETSRPKIFAGGDAISGASNVVNAMGYGKKAARLIDERLTGSRRFTQVFPEFEYDQEPPAHPSESRRHTVSELPAAERVRSFNEATIGLSPVEAMEECCRCLRCDVRNGDR
jgi:NADH-quinone oxidoreductase subunit F